MARSRPIAARRSPSAHRRLLCGKDDWAYLTVGGEEKPLLLDLTAGEHTIRMTNLGDGLALDWLALIREK